MPHRGNLSSKGRQLLSRYPRSNEKKTPKVKIESHCQYDIIRKNPVRFRKMVQKLGLTYSSSSSSSGSSGSEFDLFDSPRRRRSKSKLIKGSGSLDLDRSAPSWNLDDSFDLDNYDNPQRPVAINKTFDFDNSFDFGPLEFDSPRSSENENGCMNVDRNNPMSILNHDADEFESPVSIFSVYSDLPDSDSSPKQTMDNNNNGVLDIDSSERPTLNKANVSSLPQTQKDLTFLNIILQERLADFSSDSDDDDDGYDIGSDIGHALEDVPYERVNTDADTDTSDSDSESSDAPLPELCPQPRKMLSIPSSCSSSVLGYSKDFVNLENWRTDKPQYWDLMIKLIPPVKPRKSAYDFYYEDEEENTLPATEVEKPVVKVEASEEGYSLLKAFYQVVSESRASGEIVEFDLDNSDTLKDLISRAAKMIIPEPESEPEPIDDLSDSEMDEESFEGFPILLPVLARPGNSILYELGPSADLDQNENKLLICDTTDEPTEADNVDISWVKGRSLELTKLMESCLSFSSLKLIHKGHGFMNSEASVQIPGRTAELWPKFTFSHKMQDPIDKDHFAIKVRISYELVQLKPVLDLFFDCYLKEIDPNYVRKLSKELEGKHVFCKQIGEMFTIKKVHGKHSLMYNEWDDSETVTDFPLFRATVSVFGDKFGIPFEDFDFLQPLLECQSFDEDSNETPIFLLPQFCYLVGARSEIGNGPDFYMDMFDVSTIQRHTARSRIRQFMETFSKMPEVENELSKWGVAFMGEYMNEKTGPETEISSETELPKKSSRSLNYVRFSTCTSDEDAWEELFDKCVL